MRRVQEVVDMFFLYLAALKLPHLEHRLACMSEASVTQRCASTERALTSAPLDPQCRYYRYDRSGRDVCEGDSIEDLRKSISDMADTVRAPDHFQT